MSELLHTSEGTTRGQAPQQPVIQSRGDTTWSPRGGEVITEPSRGAVPQDATEFQHVIAAVSAQRGEEPGEPRWSQHHHHEGAALSRTPVPRTTLDAQERGARRARRELTRTGSTEVQRQHGTRVRRRPDGLALVGAVKVLDEPVPHHQWGERDMGRKGQESHAGDQCLVVPSLLPPYSRELPGASNSAPTQVASSRCSANRETLPLKTD